MPQRSSYHGFIDVDVLLLKMKLKKLHTNFVSAVIDLLFVGRENTIYVQILNWSNKKIMKSFLVKAYEDHQSNTQNNIFN